MGSEDSTDEGDLHFVIAAVLIGVGSIGLLVFFHFAAPLSDYQRINKLEARIEALEESRCKPKS